MGIAYLADVFSELCSGELYSYRLDSFSSSIACYMLSLKALEVQENKMYVLHVFNMVLIYRISCAGLK